MNTKLSIIIPVYNTERYLPKCLDSILNQTFKDLEIFCVYDESNDNSLKILKEFVEKDNRVKIIYSNQKDPGAARNLGIRLINSELVTFMDSDDWLEPNAYELAISKINEDIDFVQFYPKIIFNENEQLSEVSKNQIEKAKRYHRIEYIGEIELTDEIRLNTTVTVWNKIFKTEIIKQNNIFFPEGINHEDDSFFLKYVLMSKKAYFINEYLHNYIQRTNSRMEHLNNKKIKSFCDRLTIIYDIYSFLISKNLLNKHLNLFLNLLKIHFCIAYIDCPETNKNIVLEKATEIALKLNAKELSDNDLLKTLQNKDYSNLNKHFENFNYK